jgi:F-type H+-transporting ATPase subunit b
MSKLVLVISFLLLMSFPGVHTPKSASNQQSATSLLTPSLMAQEHPATGEHEAAAGEHASEPAEGEEHESALHVIGHYANFIILVGLIVWAVKKMLIPFLNERGRLIREEMQRSTEAIEQSNQRLTAVEDRMSNLDRELAQIREAGLNEARAERARIEKEAELEGAKILATANSEMDSAVKAARQELQSYASQLALKVAEKKIKESLTPQSDKQILNSFIDRLAGDTDGSSGARRKN